MRKSIIKALCCAIVLGISVTTISIMNSGITALAMEPRDYSVESDKELIKYVKENKNKIDINIIGDLGISNNIEFQLPAEDSLDQMQNSRQNVDNISNEVPENASTDSFIVTEDVKIDGIKTNQDIDKINLKQKVTNDQTKAIIVADDKIVDFFSDENLEKINEAMTKGYSILFESYNMDEIQSVFHKLGIEEFLQKAENENDESSDLIYQYNNGLLTDEGLPEYEGEFDPTIIVPYGAYIVKNMSGEYLYGTFSRNIDYKGNMDTLVKDALQVREEYTYYLDENKVRQKDNVNLTASAAEYYNIELENWYITINDISSYARFYAKDNKTEIAQVGEFYTYGYSKDTAGRTAFLNISRFITKPLNEDIQTLSVYYENVNHNGSNFEFVSHGPQLQPSTTTVTMGWNSDLGVNANFSPNNVGAGISAGIGFNISYSFQVSDVTVTNPNTIYPDVATVDFEYDTDSTIAKQQSEQICYSVARSKGANNDSFTHSRRNVWRFDEDFWFLGIHSHYIQDKSYTQYVHSNCNF